MTHRDRTLKTLRPDIPTIDISQPMSQHEEFQSSCLRPILKYQNTAIQLLFEQFKPSSYETLPEADQRSRIKKLLQKNIQLRYQLLGLVIAIMTADELSFYFSHEGELKKRVNSMLLERLISDSSNVN